MTNPAPVNLASSNSPSVNLTLLQRARSWIDRFAKLEDMFFDDPSAPIKRIAALELEILAMRSNRPEGHRKGSHLDALM